MLSTQAVSAPSLLLSQAIPGAQASPAPAFLERAGFHQALVELLSPAIPGCGSFVYASVCVCVPVCVALLPRLAHFNAAFSPDENIHILIKEKKCAKYKFASMIISGS